MSMVAGPRSFGNRLLDALPDALSQLIASDLRCMSHKLYDVLYELHQPVDYVYFPISAVASALTIMADGSAIEVATIGSEGLIGHTSGTGPVESANRLIVQVAGDSWRMSSLRLAKIIGQHAGIRDLVASYATAYLFQVSQAVACNGLHQLEKRCCRWILMTRDRISCTEIPLTHEFLSIMLGVRRSSVSETLAQLQADGLLTIQRGKIHLIDTIKVEARACECYRVVRDNYEKLFNTFSIR